MTGASDDLLEDIYVPQPHVVEHITGEEAEPARRESSPQEPAGGGGDEAEGGRPGTA